MLVAYASVAGLLAGAAVRAIRRFGELTIQATEAFVGAERVDPTAPRPGYDRLKDCAAVAARIGRCR